MELGADDTERDHQVVVKTPIEPQAFRASMSPLCKVLIGLDNFLYAETLQGGLSICKETQISGPQRRSSFTIFNSNICNI